MSERTIHGDRDNERAPATELDRNVAEANAALMLVIEGLVRSVSVSGLRYAEDVARLILPAAQREHIDLRIDRLHSGWACLVVGPQRLKR